MNMIVLDFEGTVRKGIREAAFLIVRQGEIVQSKEFIEKEESSNNINEEIINFLSNCQNGIPEILCAHNSIVEKNFLKEIMPYKTVNKENIKLSNKWGPWLDTLYVYRKLYPHLKDYCLKSLVERFIDKSELDKLANKHCNKKRLYYHNAMYDAICTMLLINRLESKIKLELLLIC